MSGLGTCRDCGEWIYWGEVEREGETRKAPYTDSGHTVLHWETCPAQDWVTDFDGTMYRVTQCKHCQHTVYWETTARGKKRPMDCYLDEDIDAWVSDGECHFATCVGAKHAQEARAHRARPAPKSNTAQPLTEVARRVRLWGPDLGVVYPCSQGDIVTAFRKLALKHHPDMGGQAQDFIRVKRAYDALKDLVPA